MSRFFTFTILAIALSSVAATASAQRMDYPEALVPMESYPLEVDVPPSVVGISVTGGGGFEGFVDDYATGFTDIGGAWTVRVGLFSRFLITPEFSYIGSAQAIDAVGLDPDAILLSNGGEADLRLNILPGIVQPYIFGGVGFRYYEIVNADINNSALANTDTLGIVPVGGGLTIRLDNFLLDARGTFRWAFEEEMLTAPGDEDLGMSTWSAELRAGFEI